MQISQTPRSQAQGIIAGLVATLVGVPCVAVATIAALFLQRVTMGKVLGHEVSMTELSGGEAILANVVLALLIGGIAGVVATMVARQLVKNAATASYMVVIAIGAAAIAAFLFVRGAPHTHGHTGAFAFLMIFGWFCAIAGSYSVILTDNEADARRRQGRAV